MYVGIAVLFGLGTLVLGGTAMGSEYFAGYITEKALSVDNLFVFLIIMTSFRVPRENQQKVLLVGIVFSLIARAAFIFLGSALLNTFSWVFYLFGIALLLTAGNMLKPRDRGVPLGAEHRGPAEPAAVPDQRRTTTATGCPRWSTGAG